MTTPNTTPQTPPAAPQRRSVFQGPRVSREMEAAPQGVATRRPQVAAGAAAKPPRRDSGRLSQFEAEMLMEWAGW